MDDAALGELFGVLGALGLEKRASPLIQRVPERQATIWVDVKSAWAAPSWKKLAFVFGLCHTYPRGVAIVAGVWKAHVDSWFDAWIARAKATPLELMAERRSDGSGVVIWREPPTRASLFKRLAELNESEEKWRAAAAAAPPLPAPPHPSQAVSGMTDPAQAWQALARAGLIPAPWANEPRRRFQHSDAKPCAGCGGTGVGQGYGETVCYAGCSQGYFYTDRWEPFPRTVADCVTVAEQAPGMAHYEALAFDLCARTAVWRAEPLAPSLARWMVCAPMRSDSGPSAPGLLRGPWSALAIAVPDAGMPAYTGGLPMPGWSARGAWAWSAAVARGYRIPPHFSVPAWLVGRMFGEVADPFLAARDMEALPYDMLAVDAAGMTFVAFARSQRNVP